MTLLESLNKRCLFLEHAVRVMGLSNVKVIRGRAEASICVLFIYKIRILKELIGVT